MNTYTPTKSPRAFLMAARAVNQGCGLLKDALAWLPGRSGAWGRVEGAEAPSLNTTVHYRPTRSPFK